MLKSKLLESKPSKTEAPNLLNLSVSKVKTFKDCAAKYRFSYIEKLPQKDWEFLVFGKFLHEVLEKFHKELMEGSERPYNTILTDCFKQALPNYKMTKEAKKESFDILCGYLVQMEQARREDSLPTFLRAEKDFYINIDDKILLNGFIDRIQLDRDGVIHVSDYKTTKNPKFLEQDLFQLLTYAYVLLLEDPKLEVVRGSYILLRHNFKSIVQEFPREEILKIEDIFLEYAENIQKEKLFRPNASFLCKYCSFLDNCNDGKNFLRKIGKLEKEEPEYTFW